MPEAQTAIAPDALRPPLPGGPLAALPTPRAPAKLRILDGASAFFGGIGFVFSTPRVWPYAAVPVFVLLALATGLGALGLWASWHLVSAIVSGSNA